jgi:hypothetical protein
MIDLANKRTDEEVIMSQKFSLFLLFLAVSIVPALCQASVTILSDASPNHTVISGSDEQVYGTSSSNQVILESHAKAELINFPGQNTIEIQSSAALFTVSRSGTVVTFEGSDGTLLRIPATSSVQTIDFSDRMPLTLSIHGGQVMLDGQVVTTTPASIESDPNEPVACGAYVAPGVWKEFDCYNLAAIGKTTSDDPFTPTWRLIGGYWQWGRKGPDSSQWYDTNTEHFAHGPTGPGLGDANDGEITGWDQTWAPDDAWSDSDKTVNDPCPDGFRVPTVAQWDGVLENNPQHSVGTWSTSAINYSSALFYGDNLMLPAAGGRRSSSGSLVSGLGGYGCYWSAGYGYDHEPFWALYFGNSGGATDNAYPTEGFSVRCIAEGISDKNIIAFR